MALVRAGLSLPPARTFLFRLVFDFGFSRGRVLRKTSFNVAALTEILWATDLFQRLSKNAGIDPVCSTGRYSTMDFPETMWGSDCPGKYFLILSPRVSSFRDDFPDRSTR